MDKLNLHSKDILSANVDKIGEIFPGVITEAKDENGATKKAIDFDLLRQHLSDQLVDGDRERFRLDWPGKRASILKANTPTTKTLRPVRADSEEFDTTQNIFIEGDNFEVLKVLQESYLGKIKMIYIDPPYNTGKDFIYRDNFTQDREDYEEEIGVRDDENGGKLVKNTETNGRYHSDWLSMMQERLIVALDLLTDDGVIFISIDDAENAHLRKICDEVFGEGNFLAQIVWERAFSPVNLKKHFSESHDFVLCYARNIDNTTSNGLARSDDDARYKNPDNDPRGRWTSSDMTVGPVIQEKVYDIILPSGRVIRPTSGRCWLFTKGRYEEMLADNRIWFGEDGNNTPRVKKFLTEVKAGITPVTIWKHQEVGHSQSAAQALKQLFENHDYFDYPKSVELIKRMTMLYTSNSDTIIDFFSGSGTTAHAVMQLNAEDGGNRKHIQVQLPEPTDEKSEAYKAGYKSIPEISRERIRRAGKKIREDYAEQIAKRKTPLDTGFRAYRLSSSNFINTAQHPNETTQASLLETANNIKDDRTAEDLLTETILDLGLTLDLPIEVRVVAGHTVYFVSGNSLAACFDDNVTLDIAEPLAAEKPLRVVFKDSSFASDEVRVNIDIRLKQLSPETEIKVL